MAGEAATGAAETPDFLSMTDEDFLNTMPPSAPVVEAPVEAPVIETPVAEAPAVEAPVEKPVEATPPATEAKTEEVNPLAVDDDKLGSTPPAVVDPVGSKPEDKPVEGEAKPEDKPVEPAEKPAESAPVDHEAFYKQVMAPFKANGKTIELKSPDEAIALMQMGANYTRKMQEIAPHRKALTMLQTHGITEDRLSFLIDLDKKDPEAIKKLIKDAGVDPMDIDTSVEPAYREGNHRVSDEEVNFQSALDEVSSLERGQETLQAINGWDQASKDVLWASPQIMAVIHEQRENGIYARIAAEVDRQRVLGKVPTNVPFLQAYKAVGDVLRDSGAFADLLKPSEQAAQPPVPAPVTPPAPVKEPAVVATRVAAPKSTVAHSEAASAASPTRSTPKPVQEFHNPLAVSDEEFLKNFKGRL